MADRVLAHGTATACLISPREFFREALKFSACSALAWHNHSSGDPTPFREDIQLTHRLKAAGESLGVSLADHIVLGSDSWNSFRAAEGLGYLWGLMGRGVPIPRGQSDQLCPNKGSDYKSLHFSLIFW